MDNTGRLLLADQLDSLSKTAGLPDHLEELLFDAADVIRTLVRHIEIVDTDRRVERRQSYQARVLADKRLR